MTAIKFNFMFSFIYFIAVFLKFLKKTWRKQSIKKLFLCFKLQFLIGLLIGIVFVLNFFHYYTQDRSLRHIYVLSATYFKNSSFYGSNMVVVLFNSQKNYPLKQFLKCSSIGTNGLNNEETNSIIKIEIQPVKYMAWAVGPCAWAQYVLVCPVAENMTKFSLSDLSYNSKEVSVAHRNAVTKDLGLVACFSPLFYFERWQVMFPSLEIYRQFGVKKQVYYLQSIRKEVYEFLKAYKRAGVVNIETWPIMNLGDMYDYSKFGDSNSQLEWRNQAGAHTDCFLKYRESAEFILAADIDDVLIPRHHDTYLEELHILLDHYPTASSFNYARFNTVIKSNESPIGFSLQKELDSTKISITQREDVKSFLRTEAVETAWIHFPASVKKSYEQVSVDVMFNFMLHLRNWTTSSEPQAINKSLFLYNINLLLLNFKNSNRFANLGEKADRFIKAHAKAEFVALPANSVYYKLIENCYNEIFYSVGRRVTKCPGPGQCKFQKNFDGIECAIASNNVKHDFINTNIVVHQIQGEKNMIIKANGCS